MLIRDSKNERIVSLVVIVMKENIMGYELWFTTSTVSHNFF